jgi:hypothetical protein
MPAGCRDRSMVQELSIDVLSVNAITWNTSIKLGDCPPLARELKGSLDLDARSLSGGTIRDVIDQGEENSWSGRHSKFVGTAEEGGRRGHRCMATSRRAQR